MQRLYWGRLVTHMGYPFNSTVLHEQSILSILGGVHRLHFEREMVRLQGGIPYYYVAATPWGLIIIILIYLFTALSILARIEYSDLVVAKLE